MDFYKIPLTADPNQTLRTAVPIDGKNLLLALTVQYNAFAGYWTMDIADGETKKPLVSSIPLLAGVYPAANLLGQYAYLQIGSAYLVKINPDAVGDAPDEKNLGTDFILVWGGSIE